MGFELKALLVCFALALGITAPLPELVGGMLVGLAATYAGFIVTPAESRLTVWATLFIGLLVCLVAAIAACDALLEGARRLRERRCRGRCGKSNAQRSAQREAGGPDPGQHHRPASRLSHERALRSMSLCASSPPRTRARLRYLAWTRSICRVAETPCARE